MITIASIITAIILAIITFVIIKFYRINLVTLSILGFLVIFLPVFFWLGPLKENLPGVAPKFLTIHIEKSILFFFSEITGYILSLIFR